jgi:predicted O-methyltransferase YrrM
MPYNLNIPGWMPESELKIIEQVAGTIPKYGKMVEVGPFCGRSSWCWAKSVDPTVRVACLDIWNTAEHPYYPPAVVGGENTTNADFGVVDRVEQAEGTLENFRHFTRDCSNIVPIRGASPYDFQAWKEPLDLVFLDGVHHNPIFWDDLNFWFWKLKPGGLCCGDDYARTHPDVVWGVHDFAKNHNLTFFVQGRLFFIPRPPHKNFFATLFGKTAPQTGSQDFASPFVVVAQQ